jgi:hypothetical protein
MEEVSLVVGGHDVSASFDGMLWHVGSHGRRVSHAGVVPALELLALAGVDSTTIARTAIALLERENNERRTPPALD